MSVSFSGRFLKLTEPPIRLPKIHVRSLKFKIQIKNANLLAFSKLSVVHPFICQATHVVDEETKRSSLLAKLF